MSLIEITSFISSIVSLTLAILAIWLSLYHKKESDLVNEATKELLIDVHADSKTISNIAMPELKAYGESMRRFVFETKKIDNDVDLNEIINNIKGEFSNPSASGLEKKFKTKIEELERELQRKNFNDKSTVNKGHILIDLTEFGFGIITSPISQFKKVQDVLDMIWINFLSQQVPVYTYGDRWIMKNMENNKALYKHIENDKRSLVKSGILGGMKFKIEKL